MEKPLDIEPLLAHQCLNDLEDVRAQKVERLRRLIADGSYHPDSEKIACALFISRVECATATVVTH